jgi:hypothetical protein
MRGSQSQHPCFADRCDEGMADKAPFVRARGKLEEEVVLCGFYLLVIEDKTGRLVNESTHLSISLRIWSGNLV